jgi:hypothetical protein
VESMSNVTLQTSIALSRAGIQDPSVLLGTRCVQGDLQATRGQVRPRTGDVHAPLAVRIRPVAVFGTEPAKGYVPFAGSVSPGGIRQT